jgi:hypothetical protein
LNRSISPTVNGTFGSASCSEPHRSELDVDVTLSDVGDAMMSPEHKFELVTEAASGLVLAYGDDLLEAAATELSLHEP